MHYVHAAAGFYHTVLVRSDGAAVAFGWNNNGQCGVPELPAGMEYVHAAAGYRHTVLIRSDGVALAFGSNEYGDFSVPELPAGMGYVHAAAGGGHTVLIRSDGAAVAFGWDVFGQCGVPELPAGMEYVQAAAGYRHTVLIRSDGAALAFGDIGDGQSDVPELLAGMEYVQAAAGYGHTVLARSDGVAFAFGVNGYGRCDVPRLPPRMPYAGYSKRRSLQRTVWCPQWHPLFPRSSQRLVVQTLLLELRMRAAGAGLAPLSCLVSHILPFLVPVIFRGPWACQEERAVPTAVSRNVDPNERKALPSPPPPVIQRISHAAEPAEAISPAEAMAAQEELWASGVEMLIASAGGPTRVSGANACLLLTFNRFTRELERSLLASPPASRVTAPMPEWAGGAKVFAALDREMLSALLPAGYALKPWNVVIREIDEPALFAAIAHLDEPYRRLKSGIGRRVLHNGDMDSVRASPDADREVLAIQVMNSFVHFSHNADSRSTRTA